MSRKVMKASAVAGRDREASNKVIDREVFEAHEQARIILERAEIQAADRLAAASEKAETLRRDAWHRGYREGLAEWEEKVTGLLADRRALIKNSEPEIVELALAVARKILHRQLELDPSYILAVVQEAMRSLIHSPSHRIEIRLNPEDSSTVEELVQQMQARDPHWGAVVLTLDEQMARGGCRVDSEFGQVDATLETQVEAIRTILRADGKQELEG